MTKTILYCFEDDDVTHVAKNMGENHVHRLAVLDKNKRLTGIISFGDIALKCQDARLCGQLAATLSADITERIH
jgi:predicted transcriptional regulator